MKFYCFKSDNQILESSRTIISSCDTFENLSKLLEKEETLVVGYYMVNCPSGYSGRILNLILLESQETFNHFQENAVCTGIVSVEKYLAVPKSIIDPNKIEIDF